MGADRAAAGLGGAAVMIAVAFAPKGVSVVEGIFLGLAMLVLAVSFAPILPRTESAAQGRGPSGIGPAGLRAVGR
jgi:hypothetical protein